MASIYYSRASRTNSLLCSTIMLLAIAVSFSWMAQTHERIKQAELYGGISSHTSLKTFNIDQDKMGSTLNHANYPLPEWLKSTEFMVDPALVLAIIKQESNFIDTAVSKAGANGLMQIMPQTARYIVESNDNLELSSLNNIHQPEINIALGQHYLRYLADKPYIDGNIIYLLTAYNAGPGNLIKWQKRFGNDISARDFVANIPFKETRDYVKKVLANYAAYSSLLADRNIQLALNTTQSSTDNS